MQAGLIHGRGIESERNFFQFKAVVSSAVGEQVLYQQFSSNVLERLLTLSFLSSHE